MGTNLYELSWFWIGFAAVVPFLAGGLFAYPIWRLGQPILGNIAGSILIFGASVMLIMREHADLERMTKACLDKGTTCFPDPSAFARFALYAFIGLVEVIILFSVSIRVETRLRRRDYSPEWR